MTSNDLVKLLYKYNLQFYSKQDRLDRIDYLLNTCSNLFSLDVNKIEELTLIKNNINSVVDNRKKDWKIAGKLISQICIDITDNTGPRSRFELLPYRTMKDKSETDKAIICFYSGKLKEKFELGTSLIVSGDLHIINGKLSINVKEIISRK